MQRGFLLLKGTRSQIRVRGRTSRRRRPREQGEKECTLWHRNKSQRRRIDVTLSRRGGCSPEKKKSCSYVCLGRGERLREATGNGMKRKTPLGRGPLQEESVLKQLEKSQGRIKRPEGSKMRLWKGQDTMGRK